MAIDKFVTSVADVYGYDENDVLLFSAKTLIDSSIEVTLGNTEVRGGRGNQLLYEYYHTAAMNVTLNDAQWNLSFISATTGQGIVTGNDVYKTETLTLGAGGTGTVAGTPLSLPSSGVIYGWVDLPGGTTERVTFTGSSFTAAGGAENDVVCVRYYARDLASRSVTIPANMLPKNIKLIMEAQLNSGKQSSNKIGIVQINIPRFQLNGSFTISLTSDGVTQTPLAGMALADTDLQSAACTTVPTYAKIVEILDSGNWYDNVIALAIDGGDFSLTHPATKTLVVYAVKDNGDAPFVVDNAELDFTSGTVGTATIGLHTGLVTTVAVGTTLLTASITAKPTVEASCTLTVA